MMPTNEQNPTDPDCRSPRLQLTVAMGKIFFFLPPPAKELTDEAFLPTTDLTSRSPGATFSRPQCLGPRLRWPASDCLSERWPGPASRRSCSTFRRATQKPYSPADGQIVEVTPPPFIWVPAGRDSTYVLQVSRSAAFDAPDTRTFDGLRRSVFVPRSPCPRGSGSGVTAWRRSKGTRVRPAAAVHGAGQTPGRFRFRIGTKPSGGCRGSGRGCSFRASGWSKCAVGRRRVETGDRLAGGVLRAGGRQGTGRRAGLSARRARTTGRGRST